MTEYIERAAVEKFIEDGLNNPDKNKAFGHDAIEIMAEIHYMPAADVVEVVRCKDCQYWQDNNGGYPHPECRWGDDETPDADDYCSFGERMDKEDEHGTD